MADKVEVEFRFAIGDRVRMIGTRAEFVVQERSYHESRGWHICRYRVWTRFAEIVVDAAEFDLEPVEEKANATT